MAQVNFKQLHTFVTVADQNSFRRAADTLKTTQPNISSRISALESTLNVKLMERDAGSVRLTPIGNTLLPEARKVLAAMENLLITANKEHLFDGVLRLGVTEMIVHSCLSEYLLAVQTKFPNIEIDLLVDLSQNLSTAIFSKSVDLTLQSGPFNRQTSGDLDLGTFPLVWVAAPSVSLKDTALSPSVFSRFSILTHARGTLPYEQIISHITSLDIGNVTIVPSTNLAACLRMTLDGLGIACLPEVIVRKALDNEELRLLKYKWHPDPLNFHARFDADTCPNYVSQAANIARQITADNQ
jgi:DNA-binding transcriptional LysR family regulator